MVNSKMAAKMATTPFQLAYQGSYLSNENKLGVFSRVLGIRDFTQIIHFTRKVMDHC